MDITPYVDRLRADLVAAASGSGEELRQAAERLGFAVDPVARLVIMEAISQAAAEITAEMSAGGVDVRLDGRDLAFVVDDPAPAPPHPSAPAPPREPEDDAGSLARVTLRLPEAVKTSAEEAAARAGHSLNTWLVGAVRRATSDGDVGSEPTPTSFPRAGRGHNSSRRLNGWI